MLAEWMINRFEELRVKIYPQSGTNTGTAGVDREAEMKDGAIEVDTGSVVLIVAGRPEPPPAGIAHIYLVIGICIRSLLDCIIRSVALTRAVG